MVCFFTLRYLLGASLKSEREYAKDFSFEENIKERFFLNNKKIAGLLTYLEY